MTTPAEDISNILNAASVGVKGTNLFTGHMPDTVQSVDNTIACFDTGGSTPNPKWLIDYPSVMVRVRGSKNDYDGSYAKCKSVKDALVGYPSTDLADKRLVQIMQLGDIAFLGFDEGRRPEWSLNFQLITEPGSGTNREAL